MGLRAFVPLLALCLATAAPASDADATAAGTIGAAEAATHGASVDIRSKNSQPPAYPLEAMQAGASGTVVLQVDVDAKGTLQNVSVVESSGNAALDAAAMEAARRWTYAAAMHAGSPAPGHVRIPVLFAL
ncbi:energy transducer TonB [Luteimonas sp. 3794]|uniref:energy transducer TonB n=1 Tax=Luteimonas sp. 3794 TaxID=2817730 RepID=UPI002865C6CF|nr:energy transducer TonB [Luteimonas sp. 3794]MDR6992119.1 TonB family protein [Luteimonas sp. 3794]